MKKKYTAALTVNLHMALYDCVPGNDENSLFLGKKVKDKKDILFNHGGILILLCLLFSKPAMKRCGESQSVQKMHFKWKRLSKDFFFGSLSFTNEQKHVFLPEFSLSFSSYEQFPPKMNPLFKFFILTKLEELIWKLRNTYISRVYYSALFSVWLQIGP